MKKLKRLFIMKKTKITQKEMQIIEERFEHFNVPTELRAIINEAIRALNSGEFVYDGTTLDEELAPNNIEEASLLHDYMYCLGWGGHLSNKIYFKTLKIYKASKITRSYRFLGITLGWYLGYLWKYIWIRNLKPIPDRFKNLYKIIK